MQLLTRNNLKQIGLLSLIVITGVSILKQFAPFIPGALAAATLYILFRRRYLLLVNKYRWRRWVAATLFITGSILAVSLAMYLVYLAFIPKLNELMNQAGHMQETLKTLAVTLRRAGIPVSTDDKQIADAMQKIAATIPTVLNATTNMLTNAVLALFFLYFMLVQGREMEHSIKGFMPLKRDNVDNIWEATRMMVYANAIGIPVLAASQGIVATIGYWMFGVKSFIVLGILTGLFSVVPIVGCAIVWLPVVVVMAASGETGAALGLFTYSFIITGGVDNVLRFTILKRLGDVHPVVTTIGIIIGVPMFGFMGFIFGPLIVSYLLLLIRIYRVEFSRKKHSPPASQAPGIT